MNQVCIFLIMALFIMYLKFTASPAAKVSIKRPWMKWAVCDLFSSLHLHYGSWLMTFLFWSVYFFQYSYWCGFICFWNIFLHKTYWFFFISPSERKIFMKITKEFQWHDGLRANADAVRLCFSPYRTLCSVCSRLQLLAIFHEHKNKTKLP